MAWIRLRANVVTDITDVTDVTVKISKNGRRSVIRVVCDGGSNGDLRFTSF